MQLPGFDITIEKLSQPMTNTEINCAVECVGGCRLGGLAGSEALRDRCPNQEYVEEASQFISQHLALFATRLHALSNS